MQSPVEVQKLLVRERIAQSINVSGAFDNCFFHCYGAHFLSNGLPLPEDLFSFSSILGAHSPATELQTLFPYSSALDIFAEYEQLKYPEAFGGSNHVVEKTLVLGFLLREWFATKLAANDEHMNEMLLGDNSIINIFKGYKLFRQFSDKQGLISGSEGTKYVANEAFLEYFAFRKILSGDERALLPLPARRFEQYFIDADDNDDAAITAYWLNEGYQNYCRYLAQPAVKLAPTDALPVLASLNQSLTIYNSDGSIQVSHDGSDQDFPHLDISLNPLTGHYHLFTTDETRDYLREYTIRFAEYLEERAAVLHVSSIPGKKLRAEYSNCPLVGAICCEHLNQLPFRSLVERVNNMQQVVAQAEQLEQARKIEDPQPRQAALERLEKERIRIELERRDLERQQRELQRAQTFQREKAKIQTDFIVSLRKLLPHLQPKSRMVYAALHTAQRDLFSKLSLSTDKPAVERALRQFLKTCKKQVDAADSLMDYGWLYRITEILVKGILALFVGSGMLLGGFAGQGIFNAEHRQKYQDTFFTLNTSKGCLALEAFNQQLASLRQGVKQLHSEPEESDILALQ